MNDRGATPVQSQNYDSEVKLRFKVTSRKQSEFMVRHGADAGQGKYQCAEPA